MKTNRQSSAVKIALVLGVAALSALSPQARAQSSDALIDKLVDKGILTADEAKDLRDQADNDFKTAFSAKTGMPEWVTGYKISGDVRGRAELFSTDNRGDYNPSGTTPYGVDRMRFRYRVRFGVTVNMLDNMEAGLRLASADAKFGSSGNPLSANSTMQDNFSKKMVYVDAAYGKWTALNSGNWLLATTIGKMDNPFQFTPMVFDPDITPEGAAVNGVYTFNDKQSIAFAGAAFVLDEEQFSTHDPLMYGGQILWNAKWTDKWATTVGVGAFQIVNPEQLGTSFVPNINQGNTRYPQTILNTTVPGGGNLLKYNYTPIIADASVTYIADTFPFYSGTFPIKFAGEFMNNPGAPNNNNAYWVGVTFGKSGAKKTWDLTYRYEYLEADAWYDQLVDDDNGAFYGNSSYLGYPNSSSVASPGWYAGTNVKGHMIKLNYSLTDSVTFTVTCFINTLINAPAVDPLNAGVDLNSSAIHFMADMMWKF
jgi:hypothetical protein